MTATIRIIRPAGREKNPDYLRNAILHLESEGFKVLFQDKPADQSWPFTSACLQDRVDELNSAAEEPESDIILCARGGYGCSELLPHIEFSRFNRKKIIMGFSDISTLLMAFHQLGRWPAIHSHMPATKFWDPGHPSIKLLIALIKSIRRNEILSGTISVDSLPTSLLKITENSGKLLGGNLSVLTNVLGTEFFRPTTSPLILFLEDINETPPVVLRKLMQWKLTGYLEHVQAIILGRFNFDDELAQPIENLIGTEIERKLGVKVLLSEDFGHVECNVPIALGSKAIIEGYLLKWELSS